jgi:hypothetical protein
MTILEINVPIAVHTPHGSGQALFLYDYGLNVNSIFGVRLDKTGEYKHYYSDDILIYPNPANGEPKLIIPDDWVK